MGRGEKSSCVRRAKKGAAGLLAARCAAGASGNAGFLQRERSLMDQFDDAADPDDPPMPQLPEDLTEAGAEAVQRELLRKLYMEAVAAAEDEDSGSGGEEDEELADLYAQFERMMGTPEAARAAGLTDIWVDDVTGVPPATSHPRPAPDAPAASDRPALAPLGTGGHGFGSQQAVEQMPPPGPFGRVINGVYNDPAENLLPQERTWTKHEAAKVDKAAQEEKAKREESKQMAAKKQSANPQPAKAWKGKAKSMRDI